MTFNDKLNAEEIEDMFDEFEYDDDKMILTKSIVRSKYNTSNIDSFFATTLCKDVMSQYVISFMLLQG